jgi:hypothetical protein
MIFTLIVFVNRNHFRLKTGAAFQWIAVGLLFTGFAVFSFYNYTHLPMIDFRHWKVGNKMTLDANAETRVYLKYQNKTTGEIKEYLSPDFPWNDPEWVEEWEFVDQRTESDQEPIAHNLMAEDAYQNDFTDYILESPGIFVIVAHDMTAASSKGLEKLAALQFQITEKGYPVALLTASLPEEAFAAMDLYGLHAEVFFADGVVLKTMIRSNPGLVLFYNGFVGGKWHFNALPDQQELDLVTQEFLIRYP